MNGIPIFNRGSEREHQLAEGEMIDTKHKLAGGSLREAKMLYRLLSKNMRDVIWTMDMSLRFIYVSPSVSPTLGYTVKEIMAMTLSELLPPPSHDIFMKAFEEGLAVVELGQKGLRKSRILELELVHKDSSIVWAECKMTFLRDSDGNPAGILVVAHDITEYKKAEQELRALSHRLVETLENERQFLARELHDEFGQSLTVLKLLLDTSKLSPTTNNCTNLDEAKVVIKELMSRVRELSLALHPSMLDDLGLRTTLPWLFQRYSAHTKLHIKFEDAGLDKPLPSHVATAAYRIVKESLTNVVHHANASEVIVRIWTDRSTLHIQVEDNGEGFDVNALPIGTSISLNGMRERVLLLGGNFTIESKLGTSTTVKAEVPFHVNLTGD